MPGSHNVDEVFDDIKELIDGFSFTTTVEGKSLGKDCAGIIAKEIVVRSIEEQRGESGAWYEIGEKYAEEKFKKYGVRMIGVRTGQMLSLESLLGSVSITTTDVQMLYGTGQPPTESKSPTGYLSKADKEITDIEKAYFFSKDRPFYELDDLISDRVYARIETVLEDYIRRTW
jgi:hypothetical protein